MTGQDDATRFDREILLMDEWIGPGDAGFVTRAQNRIEASVEKAGTLILDSHGTESCRQWCNKGLWMQRGAIVQFGKINAVLDDCASANRLDCKVASDGS